MSQAAGRSLVGRRTPVTEAPTSAAEVSQIMRDTTGPVVIIGGGTKQDWGGRTRAMDLVISTENLTGPIQHNPSDMTASFGAGTPLNTVADHLQASGQWLAFDPHAACRGATLGGALATADSGPRRLLYGGLRDLVIGATLVLADGTVAHTGGHVIKNVAGYDLAKLLYGSMGTLAIVTEIVVRLHPLPKATATLAARCTAAQAAAVGEGIASHPVPVAALEWSSRDGGNLLIRIEGSRALVTAGRKSLRALIESCGVGRVEDEGDATSLWAEESRRATADANDTVLWTAVLPSHARRLLSSARLAADEHGVPVEINSSLGLGIHTFALGGEPEEQAAAAKAIRKTVLGLHGATLLRRRPPMVDTLLEPLDPAPSVIATLRRIKRNFDPTGRLSPGKFHPWY